MTEARIFSIEPLMDEWLNYIFTHTGEKVCLLNRDNYLETPSSFKDAEIIICRDRDSISEIVNICAKLKFIFIVSAGVDKLPFSLLKEKGICVASTKGISSQVMSEYAIGMILAWSCKVSLSIRNQLKKHWNKYQTTDTLSNKTLLVIGAGKTGQLVAKKAKCFNMKCIGVKRTFAEMDSFDDVLSLDNIDNVLPLADYIVCTIPLTNETKYFFGIERFKKMKSSAVFINISRGDLLIQKDLINALKNSIIKGAVLDVFEREPLSNEDELWELDNLIITPHSSGRIENYMFHAVKIFTENLNDFNNNRDLYTRVSLEYCY